MVKKPYMTISLFLLHDEKNMIKNNITLLFLYKSKWLTCDDTCTEFWGKSSRVVRASDCQCKRRNTPGFNPSILRHNIIWGAADKAVLNKVHLLNCELGYSAHQMYTARSYSSLLLQSRREWVEQNYSASPYPAMSGTVDILLPPPSIQTGVGGAELLRLPLPSHVRYDRYIFHC